MKKPNITARCVHCGCEQPIDRHLFRAEACGYCVVYCPGCRDAFLIVCHRVFDEVMGIDTISLSSSIMKSDSEEDRNEHVWQALQRYYRDIGTEENILDSFDEIFDEHEALDDSSKFLDEDDDEVPFQPEFDYQEYTCWLRPVCPKCQQKYLFELECTHTGNPIFFARRCVRCGAAFSIVVNPERRNGDPDLIELFTPDDYRSSTPFTFPDLWEWMVKHNCPRQRYAPDYSREGHFTLVGTIGDAGWSEKEWLSHMGGIPGHDAAIFVACEIDLLLLEMRIPRS